MLTATVSFDKKTHLYTYSYTVDNDTSGLISELGILVTNPSNPNNLRPPKAPLFSTAPKGRFLTEVVSGSVANPPYNEVGGIFEWVTLSRADAVKPGAELSAFSVTVRQSPAANSHNNYFLLGGTTGRVVNYGHIAAPLAVTPLSDTFLMFGGGLSILLGLLWLTSQSPRVRNGMMSPAQ
jgi:hypothetical protein